MRRPEENLDQMVEIAGTVNNPMHFNGLTTGDVEGEVGSDN
jgi:hypothetical protein